MARFRLFGRPSADMRVSDPADMRVSARAERSGAPGNPSHPATDHGPSPYPTAGPPGAPPDPGRPSRTATGGPGPTGAGPATRAARPARSRRDPTDDPITDPIGFAPVRARMSPDDPGPAVPPVRTGPPAAAGRNSVRPPTPDPADAAALAGAFAADYLSWDQDDPDRRGRVLLEYLQAPGTDPARLGWSGQGRQRADFALPGRMRPDGDGRVLVDVRVRVTPYRSVGEHGTDPAAPVEPDPDVAGTPASAPAPTGRGWRSLASHWIRLSVPICTDGGRLVVDAWEETLGEEPPAPAPDAEAPPDLTLADDDPLAEPATGGAW